MRWNIYSLSWLVGILRSFVSLELRRNRDLLWKDCKLTSLPLTVPSFVCAAYSKAVSKRKCCLWHVLIFHLAQSHRWYDVLNAVLCAVLGCTIYVYWRYLACCDCIECSVSSYRCKISWFTLHVEGSMISVTPFGLQKILFLCLISISKIWAEHSSHDFC